MAFLFIYLFLNVISPVRGLRVHRTEFRKPLNVFSAPQNSSVIATVQHFLSGYWILDLCLHKLSLTLRLFSTGSEERKGWRPPWSRVRGVLGEKKIRDDCGCVGVLS